MLYPDEDPDEGWTSIRDLCIQLFLTPQRQGEATISSGDENQGIDQHGSK